MNGIKMNFCFNCGSKLEQGSVFCENCGVKISTQDRQTADSPSRNVSAKSVFIAIAAVLFIGAVVFFGIYHNKVSQSMQGAGAQLSTPKAAPTPDPQKLAQARSRIEEHKKKAEANPKDPQGWKHLGSIQYEVAVTLDRTQFKGAIESYKKALELSPDDMESVKSIADACYDSADHSNAIEYYRKYLDKIPDDPAVRTDMATMYLYSGNPDEAIEQYQRVLKSQPDFINAQFNLGNAYRAKEDWASSLAAYKKTREMAVSQGETTGNIDHLITMVEDIQKDPEGYARKKAEEASQMAGGKGGVPDHPPIGGGETQSSSMASASPPSTGTFKGDIEAVFNANQVLGPKVEKIEWVTESSVKIHIKNFPIDLMSDDMREKFFTKLTRQMEEAKGRFDHKDKIGAELVNESGETLTTLGN